MCRIPVRFVFSDLHSKRRLGRIKWCGSRFFNSRSRSWSRSRLFINPDPYTNLQLGFWISKSKAIWTKLNHIKECYTLIPRPHKGLPSSRRGPQYIPPQKQLAFQKIPTFSGPFCCSWSEFKFGSTDPIRFGIDSHPNQQHWSKLQN